jgi:hypothetical protein
VLAGTKGELTLGIKENIKFELMRWRKHSLLEDMFWKLKPSNYETFQDST